MKQSSSRLPLVEAIVENLENHDMMNGPCAFGQKKVDNQYGGYYTISWSIPRWADGCIYFFNKNKISVRWMYGGRKYNLDFKSIEELNNWIKNQGYTGNTM
jgi:hypothetical protein